MTEKKKPGMKEWITLFVLISISGKISGFIAGLIIDSSSDLYKPAIFVVWIIYVTTLGIMWKSRYIVPGKVPTKGDDQL